MKALAKNVAALLLIVIGAGVIGALDRPTPSLEYKLFNYVESGLPSFDPVTLIDYISEYECTGRQSPMKFPVSYTAPGNTVMVRRSYANTTGLLVNVRSTYDPSRLVLVGQELQPLGYPFKMTGDYFPYLLYLNRDALEINIKGDLFNYTGWDGETYHVLRVTYVNPFSVKSDPKPLSEAQVELYTDQVYYYVDDTAKVTIRNLSDDWLLTDRSLTLYRDVNGSWVETQGYPDDYFVTAEIVGFFPGTTWSHQLPLRHLVPGAYKLVKEVWHRGGPKVTLGTRFNVVEELVDHSNSTHMFGLRAINCTLPTVPDRVPVARMLNVPITAEDAEEIAVNVFGFEEPYEVEGETNPSISEGGRGLEFTTRYDIMYRSDPGSFNDWNRTRVIQVAEEFLSRLEPYWVDPTPLNYTIVWVGPSHISSGSTFGRTIREVGVRYKLTLAGVPLEGPGADFMINVCSYEVTSCEIRRPVLVVEGYTDVTVTPAEAVRRMLRGESATPGLGFGVDQALPRGSELTITSVTLTHFTGLSRYQEWLTPVYVIRGVARIDPVVYGEETSSFHWYVYATDFRPPK